MQKILDEFTTHLLQGGYKLQEIKKKHMNSASIRSRQDLLKTQQNCEKYKIPLVLITKYHNSIGKIGFHLRKHWKCRKFFTENPITS